MQIYTMETSDLYALLESRRLELGLTQAQLGQLAFGRPDSSAIQNLKRGSSPTIERLQPIAEALGLEVYIGPKRSEAGLADPAQTYAADRPYLPLPWHRIARSRSAPPIALSSAWLTENKMNPENLSVVCPAKLFGDDADLTAVAVIDESAIRTAAPEVWALSLRGKVVVALIQNETAALVVHQKGMVRLMHGAEREATIMLGKVVWIGQRTAAPDPNSKL